jgi:phosphoglycerate dehydrogenase-like enzyme
MNGNTSNTVIVFLSEKDYNEFITPNLEHASRDFSMTRVDPASGLSKLYEAIDREQASVVVMGWSSLKFPADFIEKAPSITYICYLCGEVGDKVPGSLLESGVKVTNWGASISHIVAEHALLLVLGCLRKLSFLQVEIHQKRTWPDVNDFMPQTLFGKRVGIHGFGAIGQKLVDLLKPFNCSVSAYSPSVPAEMFSNLGVSKSDSLEDLFSQNEVLVELAPGSEKNRNLVTYELLSSIPEGGVFVNIGRGMVVDEDTLYKVARSGKVFMGLDVFDTEPLPENSPLRGFDSVLLTPHIGGPTPDTRRLAGLFGLENVKRYFRGEELLSKINPERYACLV